MSDPPAVERLLRQGSADHQAGRLQDAEAAYRKVLALEPAQSDALHLLGVIAHQTGQNERAVDYIRRAIELNPDFAEAHGNLGTLLRKLGRNAEAEACLRESLRLRPESAGTHNNLGNLLCGLGRYEEAAASFREALRLRPDHAGARANLGILLSRLHSTLAHVLFDLGRAAEAEASCREVLRLRPDDPQAYLNLGSVLRVLGRPAEAVEIYREALRLRPELPEVLSNLGNAYYHLARVDEAVANYRAALRLWPDVADIHANLSYALLLGGRLADGWEEFEWRWKTQGMARAARNFPAPLWNGEPIGGRVILLHAEQGLGDTLQFCRYVPLVAAGARTILEVPAPLARLLSRLPGNAEIAVQGKPLPPFDLHCPLMSLPRAFATTLETIPATVPYLSAPPESVAAWRQRLAGLAGLHVGLVWAGGPRWDTRDAAVDARRSLRLAMLAPLAEVPGVSFISLQKGKPSEQSANPPAGMTLHDFTAGLHDFADTAAVVENLDLVISVDTAVAHLAGALGKPVWLLNRFAPDWRWLLDRDDSPWYPTLRQFRQPSSGDWTSVMQTVREALHRLAAGDRDQLRPRNQAASGSVRAVRSA